jgi:hypothetical protein
MMKFRFKFSNVNDLATENKRIEESKKGRKHNELKDDRPDISLVKKIGLTMNLR